MTNSLLNHYIEKAKTQAKRLNIDVTGGSESQWDAFRHAFVSAHVANFYGSVVAYLFGSAIEFFGDNQPNEHKMDIHNNKVGIEIGGRFLPGASYVELANNVKTELDKGSLITSFSDPRIPNVSILPTLPDFDPSDIKGGTGLSLTVGNLRDTGVDGLGNELSDLFPDGASFFKVVTNFVGGSNYDPLLGGLSTLENGLIYGDPGAYVTSLATNMPGFWTSPMATLSEGFQPGRGNLAPLTARAMTEEYFLSQARIPVPTFALAQVTQASSFLKEIDPLILDLDGDGGVLEILCYANDEGRKTDDRLVQMAA